MFVDSLKAWNTHFIDNKYAPKCDENESWLANSRERRTAEWLQLMSERKRESNMMKKTLNAIKKEVAVASNLRNWAESIFTD